MTHSPFTAIDDLHEVLGIGSVVVVAASALIFGSRPQRLCGLIVLVDAFAVALLTSVLPDLARLPMVHLKAILVLAAYGWTLAIHGGGWLILLTGLQGFAVMLHLARWYDPTVVIQASGLALNLTGWAMLIILLTAVVTRVSPGDKGAGWSA